MPVSVWPWIPPDGLWPHRLGVTERDELVRRTELPKLPAAKAAPEKRPDPVPESGPDVEFSRVSEILNEQVADSEGAVTKKKAPAKKAAPKVTAQVEAKPAPEPKAKPINRPLDDTVEFVNILYSGDGGSGKTTDIAAMAHLGRTLLINAESGVKARALRRVGIPTENIMVRPDVQSGEVLSFEMLESLFWELKSDLEADPKSWVGIGWDSITEIHQNVLKAATEHRVAKALRTGKGNDDATMIDLADYGVMTEQMRLLLRRFRDLPCHFAMSSLLRRDKDDDGKVVYRPAVTPKLGGDVFGYMDLVCVTSEVEVAGETEYQGLFGGAGKFRGKDRFHALPRRLINPQFHRVAAYINDELTAEDDPEMVEGLERRRRAKLATLEAEETPDEAAEG